MEIRYKNWIDAVRVKYGQCAEITKNMAVVFPELTRVRGYYNCPIWGKRAHWWLVDLDGEIVDPTAEQFPSRGMGEYIQWREGDKEPTGKCLNCGEHCYDGRYVCSDECAAEYVAYVG